MPLTNRAMRACCALVVAALPGCNYRPAGVGPRAMTPDSGSAPGAVDGGRAGTLALLAGALGGNGNIDGVGAQARFTQNTALVYDGSQYLYVADGDAVRRVEAATGAVTTIAGSVDESGTRDGNGRDARFSGVRGLALHGLGQLYVADTGNSTVRQIDLGSGAVTTLAGLALSSGHADGALGSARFTNPYALVVDSARHLYVGDFGDSTVRVVDLATGTVDTLAGVAGQPGTQDGVGTAARFMGVVGLQLDNAGGLLVVDENVTLRRLDLATHQVTTIFSHIGSDGLALYGPVLDGQGHLLASAPNQGQIVRIDLGAGQFESVSPRSNGWTETDGPLGSAAFAEPMGLAIDGAGHLFVADQSTLRSIDLTTHEVGTLAGALMHDGSLDGIGAGARFTMPRGLATDGTVLFVADMGSTSIRRIDPDSGSVTTLPATATALSGGAEWLANDGLDHLYLTNGRAGLFVVDLTTGTETLVTSTTLSPAQFAPNGAVIAAGGLAVDGHGHAYITEEQLQPKTFSDPVPGAAVDEIDLQTQVMRRLAGGTLGSTDGLGPQADFNGPTGLAADGQGHLYIADTLNFTIRVVDLEDSAVTTLAGSPGQQGGNDGVGSMARFASPGALSLDGAGHLFVIDDTTVRRIDLATATVTTVGGVPGEIGVSLGELPGNLNQPTGIAVRPGGARVFVSDLEESAILVLDF